MPAGPTQLGVKDAGNTTRNMVVQSDTGAIGGNLSPLQTIMGQDGATLTSATNPFPVNANVTGGNVTILAPKGNATAANSISVVIATNQGPVPITGNISSTNPSVAPTAAAVPGNATAVGWSDAGGNLQIPSATNPLPVNIVLGNATLSGNATVTGPAAGNATVAGNPVQVGYRAVNAEPNPVNGNNTVVQPIAGIEGKAVNLPFSIKENMLRGSASTTGSGATTIIAAQGAGVKIYVTSLQAFRTDSGNTTAFLTLNDSASTTVILPVGGGSNPVFATPLAVAANTTLTFTASTGLSTVFCSAQGYAGS